MKTYLWICAVNEDSAQPAYSRIFTGRFLDSQGCKVSSCGQLRLMRLRGCAGLFKSSLGAHVRRYVYYVVAHIISLIQLIDNSGK